MKILNLYCGIGGNRLLWRGHHVTAVDNNPKILALYKKLFPRDKIVCADAHEFLLKHHSEFDFIWSSIPCTSHTRLRLVRPKEKVFPDLKLYEEILFLAQWHKGNWVVENVRPYYKPLIPPTIAYSRHLFWSNLNLSPMRNSPHWPGFGHNTLERETHHHKLRWLGFKIPVAELSSRGIRPRQLIDNCVHPAVGLHILNQVQKFNPPTHNGKRNFKMQGLAKQSR